MNLRKFSPFETPIEETPILVVGEQAENFEADNEMNQSNTPKSSEVCANPNKPIEGNGTTGLS